MDSAKGTAPRSPKTTRIIFTESDRLLFIDTGAFYALADRRDPAHARAREFYASCEAMFFTTEFVFAETMSLLTKRLSKQVAVTFGQAIQASPTIRIEDPSAEVRQQAWQLFTTHLDKDYDLIDCLSFALMEAVEVRHAFGFDRHFTQYGFRLVPD